ncbi:3-oxoacyl-[acyl-carrier-protein] reductase FabG-like [Anastrepha obliqua]|uniref:3-oxoacyl-[acyl-carrier-protein] reductase FabG-like n=1 Tax=Anastrepha obliqua TaxID=95512 RepID=UPI00240A1272|nr:3-oxoacyl-[acyl-carrier-protein] reductase FabG-like [Anastrepha obliqua]
MFPIQFNHSIDLQEPVVIPPPRSPLDFKNKVIIITGANSGIGAATAMEFAKWGGLLTVVGHNKASLREVADKVIDVHEHSPLIVHADMTKQEEVRHIVDKTMATYGRIDVLVNNASVVEIGNIETTTMDQYDRVMDINIRAVFQLTSLAVPHLIDTKGCIVNVSSISGIRSFPGILAYNISKAALDQFTRCIALELRPKGVRCNSVNPSVIIKDVQKSDSMDDEVYEAILEQSKITHASGRAGLEEEVAGVIAFLASNMASFITGATLPVDDGHHAMCAR